MKIGILTLGLHFNYGGILQAYALQTYLKKLGHETWLINNSPLYKFDQSSKSETFLHLVKLLLGKKYISAKNEFEFATICANTNKFINKYITPATPPLTNNKSYKYLDSFEFDAVIVGSDQVWSKRYSGSNNMFLEFVKNKAKKISYAASFGEDKWLFSRKRTKIFKNLIADFDAISVREDSGVTLCQNYLGVNAVHTLDPTMLLTTEDYSTLCKNEGTKKCDGDLMLYLLDETKNEIGLNIAKYYGLKPFSIRSKTEDSSASIKNRIFPPVTNWLQGFNDAKFVVTDSFHGTAFSILHNKQFIVLEHGIAGNARMISLLKKFGLENRLINNKEELTDRLLSEEIDFSKVNTILQSEQYKANEFLTQALI